MKRERETYIAESAIRAGVISENELNDLTKGSDVKGLATPVVIDNQPRLRIAFQGQAEHIVTKDTNGDLCTRVYKSTTQVNAPKNKKGKGKNRNVNKNRKR